MWHLSSAALCPLVDSILASSRTLTDMISFPIYSSVSWLHTHWWVIFTKNIISEWTHWVCKLSLVNMCDKNPDSYELNKIRFFSWMLFNRKLFNLLSRWSEKWHFWGHILTHPWVNLQYSLDRSPVKTMLIGLVSLYYVFKHNSNMEIMSTLMIWSHIRNVTNLGSLLLWSLKPHTHAVCLPWLQHSIKHLTSVVPRWNISISMVW